MDRVTDPVTTASGQPAVPRPGGIFDPVARALEVIGDRWTLVLVRQLLPASRRFQELRMRTGIAPRVLSSRLRELVAAGFVRTLSQGSRSVYGLTEQGRSLEPIVNAIGRWWIQRGVDDLGIDAGRFTETSAQSVLEALPFMVREDRARDVDLTFEIRLKGPGGGAWSVRVHDGACTVTLGFAENADVRYTADGPLWCGIALGLIDAPDAFRRGLLTKEGGREAMDDYFHQVSRPERPQNRDPQARPASGSAPVNPGRRRKP
ncbi:MAG: helix-turn-helix transcriptional regulator [Myxococcales bacterium]|nr:helix-turn-helix transcriptional regulator [Myxococcales bacterium]